MITQLASILNAFDHLVEMMQDSGIDMEVISMVENAKEALEEQYYDDGEQYSTAEEYDS